MKTFGALLVALVCCAAIADDDVRVAKSWTTPDLGTGNEVKKILVVGITSNRETRRHFENRFVSHLRGRGYDGATSHSLVEDLGRIENRRVVLDKIAELGIDSAISVRLVPLADRTAKEWFEAWDAALERETTLKQLIGEALPDSETKTRWYGIEVVLWEAGSGRRLWAARTGAHTMKQLRKGAGDFVQDVLGSLKLARLL